VNLIEIANLGAGGKLLAAQLFLVDMGESPAQQVTGARSERSEGCKSGTPILAMRRRSREDRSHWQYHHCKLTAAACGERAN
jgi:hypothetical protein